jgi:hypothetical protein
MSRITLSQYLAAYRFAIKVHSGEMPLSNAKTQLVKIGVNGNSAVDLVRDYQKLREGRVYKRALSSGTTDDFLKWILRDNGAEAHRTAVRSLEQHIKYYQGYSGSPMQSHVTVLEKHQRLAKMQDMGVRPNAPTSEAVPLPSDCWIFQYNPDKVPHLEEDFKVGTILTWHVGQHATLMKPGQEVYLWRAAGKKKRPCGIVAASILQEKPKIQRQFTHPTGALKTFDPGDPELCVSLNISRVFLETEKMLGKEAIQQDDILRQLEIVTMARHTNYPVEALQAQRIDRLLRIENIPAVPVYQDFGEAPNDDPNELRIFAAKIRRGQPQFREKLIRLYRSKCAITGTEVQDVLEACHILLHSKSGNNHSDNGILLRSDIHVLFDSGMIRINPSTLTVIVDPMLRKSIYNQYHGLSLPTRSDGSQISKKFLAERYA